MAGRDRGGAGAALARRTLADARTRTISFALLFLLGAAAQTLTYESTYPTLRERLELARTFGSNKGLWVLYGVPHRLTDVGGWAQWRLGFLPIVAGLFGILAAVRAMRAEEDAGRRELVLAAPVSRATVFRANLAGIGASAVLLWACLFAGIAAGGPDVGSSALLALALSSPIAVFAGVGAVTSQIAPYRRMATAMGGGALALAMLLRMVADGTSRVGWLRWLTPLGWAEEVRPFTGARPLVLVLPLVATAALLWLAARLGDRRDIGAGLVGARDTAPPRLRLLGSPAGLAVRTVRGGVLAWWVSIGIFALVVGGIADSVASGLSDELRRQLESFGGDAGTVTGFLGVELLFFVFAICLFVCFELSAVRDEEAESRLETLLVLPLSRRRWLLGRLGVIAAAATALALTSGILAWAGAVSQGADVPFGRMVEAGANALPPAFLFLALGALALALAPRAGPAIAYAVTSVAFLWEAIGAVAGFPDRLLALSPFHHVAAVPAEPFATLAAVVMLAVAAVAGAAAIRVFERRDLTGA